MIMLPFYNYYEGIPSIMEKMSNYKINKSKHNKARKLRFLARHKKK